ncbi:hypothetical protein BDZ89DRAFT_650271 [Hymenopellis radicata]|nr:hypothetical protein BDZ89DRAFT_650271 [Hymenopellis radicata]
MSDTRSDAAPGGEALHPDFASPDADVFIRSSDGIVFNLHRANIITHTMAFPIPEGGDPNIADFQEPANILAIAFAYLYPRAPLPDMNLLDFDTLEAVGYVAHKYQFAALMAFCDSCIPAHATKAHPANVLRYAVLHGFPLESINMFALHTIDLPARVAREILGAAVFEQWVMYREDWLHPVAADGGIRNLVSNAVMLRPLGHASAYTEQLASQVKISILDSLSGGPVSNQPQWGVGRS